MGTDSFLPFSFIFAPRTGVIPLFLQSPADRRGLFSGFLWLESDSFSSALISRHFSSSGSEGLGAFCLPLLADLRSFLPPLIEKTPLPDVVF